MPKTKQSLGAMLLASGAARNFHLEGQPSGLGQKSPSEVQGEALLGGSGRPSAAEAEAVSHNSHHFWSVYYVSR